MSAPASIAGRLASEAGSAAGIHCDGRWRGLWPDAADAILDPADTLVGASAPIEKVRRLILRVAPTQSTVLIGGESGTGKELAARAIHRASRRASGPLVAVNCAALTETLLESELFGHEKGAFTGALALKKGRFELADGGTIFLDEIGCMALNLQAKLLRVLEDHRFERVGGTRTIEADVRLIAATNTDLEQAVRHGAFREDLYYRLKVITIVMPPLREHKEDISLLVRRFARELGRGNGRRMISMSPEAMSLLLKHNWPGNVRELYNAVEHAYVVGSADLIQPDDLPEAVRRGWELPHKPTAGYREALEEAKKQIIVNAYIQAGGRHTHAARVLGLHPNYLSRLVRNLNLQETLARKARSRIAEQVGH